MMLRTSAVVTSVLVTLPAAALVTWSIDRTRAADLETALVRVVTSQVNDQVRERCESDPTWFFTGPQEGRPTGGVFVPSLSDQLEPRPRPEPQPFELFAYAENFGGSSPAAPRFPAELRVAMRQSSRPAVLPYESERGTGVQVAVPTGWNGSVCMYFLGRMEPPPNQTRQRILTFLGLFAITFLAAWATTLPLTWRVRRLAKDARESVDGGFTAIAPDQKKDELSSLTFVLNDSSQVLHERRARIDDLDEALRRFVQTTEEDVARPLANLEGHLASLAAAPAPTRDAVNSALQQAHILSNEIDNLMAASRLKMLPQTPPRAPFDLSAVVRRVVERHTPLAEARRQTLRLAMPHDAVTIAADESLLERAIANMVDNAVRYTQEGGVIDVALQVNAADKRFRLFVVDNGPGVSDEHFRGLTAVRRFRGDESRNRRPNAPGLGIVLTREVCDRYGLQLDLKRPAAGGFEVEISGGTAA
jgi:signal transduction histidine kinase